MNVTRTVDFHDATPIELASLFADMDSADQAEFFNELSRITAEWGGLGWCGQCAYLVEHITSKGRDVVLTLAGHLQEQATKGTVE